MTTRYKEYVDKMLNENKEIFDEFRVIHDEYSLNQESNQDDFNKKGKVVMSIIKEYENRLCANQERGIYNKFSFNLAEKFQNEIRKVFPMIDYIGLVTEAFTLKKINLG